MRRFCLSKYLIGTIENFLSGQSISMSFENQTESPTSFTSGLPQGSPLSPVLFILYASALITAHNDNLRGETIYVNDVVMIQGAPSVPMAHKLLQTSLDTTIQKASFLNIKLAPDKSELMHLVPTTSKLKPNTPDQSVTLYGKPIPPLRND